MKRGRPFEPGNPFGHGRPPGSPNKRSLIAQELLDSHGEAILRKALVMGLQGDSLLLRTLLSYILTRRTDLPVKTGPLCMGTPAELSGTFEQLLKKVATQQLTLREAQQIAALIEGRRRVIETEELEARLRVLERRPGEKP